MVLRYGSSDFVYRSVSVRHLFVCHNVFEPEIHRRRKQKIYKKIVCDNHRAALRYDAGNDERPHTVDQKIYHKRHKHMVILYLLFLLVDTGMVMVKHDAEKDGTYYVYRCIVYEIIRQSSPSETIALLHKSY